MRRRATLILAGLTVVAAAVFLQFPDLDLAISRATLRPDGHFLLYWVRSFYLLHQWLQYLVPAVIVFFAIAGIAWYRRRPVWGITAWQALYVIAVFAIGPGLLVNTVLKDNSHRPRPGDTQEFGGKWAYAPPLDFGGACDDNCSFVAGDPAAGFGFLAPALLLPARRRTAGIAGALILGGVIGAMRILQGGHFFSDVIFCGLVVAATALTLHWAMFGADEAPRGRWGQRLSS